MEQEAVQVPFPLQPGWGGAHRSGEVSPSSVLSFPHQLLATVTGLRAVYSEHVEGNKPVCVALYLTEASEAHL